LAPGQLWLHAGAARDALNFAALSDRFIHNLRRCVGGDVQSFAAELGRPVTATT
jgi:hypothetical protein